MVSISKISSAALISKNMYIAPKKQPSFTGEKNLEKEPDTGRYVYPLNYRAELIGRYAVKKGRILAKEGQNIIDEGKSIIESAGPLYEKAKNIYSNSIKLAKELRAEHTNVLYYPDGKLKVAKSKDRRIREFDENEKCVKETKFEDEDSGVNRIYLYGEHGNKDVIVKGSRGLVYGKDVSYLAEDKMMARKVYSFGRNGNLITYAKNFVIQEDMQEDLLDEWEHFGYDLEFGKTFLFNKKGKPILVSVDSNRSNGIRMSKMKYFFDNDTGKLTSAARNIEEHHGRTNIEQFYVFPTDDSSAVLDHYSKNYVATQDNFDVEYHFDYKIFFDDNNNVLYVSKA